MVIKIKLASRKKEVNSEDVKPNDIAVEMNKIPQRLLKIVIWVIR